MEVVSLSLRNFRQFREADIEFAREDDGVTVIHGRNGSGKTTLLSAFPWIFYGDLRFPNGIEHLPNEGTIARAAVGERVRVTGSLTFEHESTTYTAERWAEFRKTQASSTAGVLEDTGIELEATTNGGMREIQNPETRLGQILPERLSDLFFFDGETIDELAGIDNQDQVQEAIQNLMGLTIIERAINHLESVEGVFEERMEEHGSDNLQALIEEKANIEDKIESKVRERGDLEGKVSALDGQIHDLKAKLEELEESSELERERTRLENRRDELENRIESIGDEIRATISDSAYLEFAMPAIRETAEELDSLRERGEIPSELSNEFIQRLLDREQCLCDRPLEPGSDPYATVESWQSNTTVEGIDQAAVRLVAHLEQVADGRSELFDLFDELVAERSDIEARVNELTEAIDEIGSQLETMDSGRKHEDPAELERARQDKADERRSAREQIVRLNEQIERLEAEQNDLNAQIDDAEDEHAKALTARRRRQAAAAVREDLETEFDKLQTTVKDWSDELVSETFDEIARKQLDAEITDDFELIVRQQVGDKMVETFKSTGERQIASLAFIGSLVSIARERYRSDNQSPYFTGGIYPIVMDSPFGALDDDHSRQVGRLMPRLADQVIVLATDAQWQGPVEAEMREHVGQQYWLEFELDGDAGNYPVARVESEAPAVAGGEAE